MDNIDSDNIEHAWCPKSPTLWRSQRRIQRLTDCHHFHYPSVEIGPVAVNVTDVRNVDENVYADIDIESNGTKWSIRRTIGEIVEFDRQLHRCVFERRHSHLEELELIGKHVAEIQIILVRYAERFSQLTGSIITCYPVLKFLEIDSRGNRFEPADESSINILAIAAAVVTKEFSGTEEHFLNLKIGDILSIIEMNSAVQNGRTFWKAKLTISSFNRPKDSETDNRISLEVGFFPSDCVRLIDDKRLPSSLVNDKRSSVKTARRMTELIKNRVRRREPIFGMDLSVHLDRSGRSVPLIVERCCEAIEKLGIVTGIYRQCGIQSNIQRLRAKFDNGNEPDLFEFGQRDIYSVSSLLKQYFRQLPNPLFSFEVYSKILVAYDSEEDKSGQLRECLRKLPATHYRTATYLMQHLNRLCEYTQLTDMTSNNLSIVWAPNLFRCPPSMNGTNSHVLSGLNVHTSLCSYLITNAQSIFEVDTNENGTESHDGDVQSSAYSQKISKSATLSDMRSPREFRWPRFNRGRSVEGFWKFGRRSTLNNAMSSSITTTEPVKWRRSHSSEGVLQNVRSDSIFSIMSRGMDEIRGGMRSLRERARSLRPSPRPTPSPIIKHKHHRASPTPSPVVRKEDRSIDSININNNEQGLTQITQTPNDLMDVGCERTLLIPPAIMHPTEESEENSPEDRKLSIPRTLLESRERKVMFQQETANAADCSIDEEVLPLCERSSPVEEWSSDSSESPHLEMSRYDNVSPSGTLNRGFRNAVTSKIPQSQSLFDHKSRPFLI